MVQIKEIVNSVFTSKTYILFCEGEDKVWLVDIGDVEPVVEFLNEKDLAIEGVFLTHAHFDHIYGLTELVKRYPQCKVYATIYTKEAMADAKLNMSRYHGTPIEYDNDQVVVVREGEKMLLFDGEADMYFFETPGHNPGCLTMVLSDMIFTGDAYIPEVGANTRVPQSNKELAQQSMERILKLADGKTIFSGHFVKQ